MIKYCQEGGAMDAKQQMQQIFMSYLSQKYNKDDINILNIWKEKSKTSNYYKNAINIWTNTDVIKRNTAKKNNLNYLEIFSININDIITEIKKRINI